MLLHLCISEFKRLATVPIAIAIALMFGLSQSPAGTLAHFHTPFGYLEVELYDKDKPITVGNFLHYVQSGAYSNEFCHRLVPGFVVQGGGFYATNVGTTNWQAIAITNYPPITNEFGVGKFYSNVFGTIAMAKTSDPNSATSQFFFNLADNSASLDNTNNSGGFTVFGHVIYGTNILTIMSNFVAWSGHVAPPRGTNLDLHQYYNPPFDDLPLLHPYVDATNFLFMDISLLQVSIQTAAGRGKQISWNSAAGLTNFVEFTTNLPPIWTTLIHTNGNGSRMTVVDAVASPRRFYRVRVSY